MKKQMIKTVVLIVTIFLVTTLAGGTKKFDSSMQPILKEYLKIHTALTKNKTDGIKNSAKKILSLTKKVDPKIVSGEHATHYKHIPMNLKKSAKQIIAAKNIKEMREAFKNLSKPMAMWASMSKPDKIKVGYCAMAKASWLQKGAMIMNPYDMTMPHCGSFVGGDLKKSTEKHHKM